MTTTNRLVFIHMPKTGGTFVRTMLMLLHGVKFPVPRFTWTRLKWFLAGGNVAGDTRYGPLWHHSGPHGTRAQMPSEHSGKVSFGCVRNPFDWLVSSYEWNWWWRLRRHRWIFQAVPGLRQQFPRFPELSFEECVRLGWRAAEVHSGRSDLGFYTMNFIRFHARNVEEAYSSVGPEYFSNGRHKCDMGEVRFVRTDQLNRDLFDLLKDMGYGEEDLDFILHEGKVLPHGRGRTEEQKWEKYFSPELRREVRHRERFFLELYPEYDLPQRERFSTVSDG